MFPWRICTPFRSLQLDDLDHRSWSTIVRLARYLDQTLALLSAISTLTLGNGRYKIWPVAMRKPAFSFRGQGLTVITSFNQIFNVMVTDNSPIIVTYFIDKWRNHTGNFENFSRIFTK
uniref:Uncharacterized protein n=1 Tax=Bracon brevicornis TaxID=1563983 RepID=A0A6V7LXH7_9HYME